MKFDSIEILKEHGFIGFKSLKELILDHKCIPSKSGVYMVLHPKFIKPVFVNPGTGAHLKGRNPNKETQELEELWVPDSLVIYIGKAGGEKIQATLYSRLRAYLLFGQGKSYTHWGGRLIWQLQSSPELLVCWKLTPNENPRTIEKELIDLFKTIHKKRPFANLTG